MPGLLKTFLPGIAGVLIVLLLTAVPCIAQPAAADAPAPRVSFGLGATMGYEDAQITGSNDMIWDSGTVLGAGFIVEYMWNQRFGLHSGVWAMLFRNDLVFGDGGQNVQATSRMVTIPLYLITSFRSGRFACDFLTGFMYSYVQNSTFRVEDDVTGAQQANITQYIDKNQFGIGGGIELKFGITRFIDIFVGGIAEYYLTDFIDSEDKNDTRFYTFRATAGFLFRTF